MRHCCCAWARGTERGWEAIEEAALFHELAQRHSLRELSLRVGRELSWVCRRLSLFKAVPEELLAAVRSGKLSVWAATRILAPLARANSAHARTLLGALEQTPRSTRELERLFAQYQRAPQAQRKRLVEYPGLFVQALERRAEAAADRRLSEGPEGAWCQDLGVSEQVLKRLCALVPTVFCPQQAPPERAPAATL